MNSLKEVSLQTPDEFDFPFPPYNIQLDFMKKLYYTLEHKLLGIFESPTGTGKSLSVICGAIRWLKDHNLFEETRLLEKIDELEIEKNKLAEETVDWLTSQSKELEIENVLRLLRIEKNKLIDYNKKIKDIQENVKKHFVNNKKAVRKTLTTQNDNKEEDIIEDADILPEELEVADDLFEEEEPENKYEPVKIYICSRTHSQLAQFLGEVVKSPFGNDVRIVSLASRQSYCINPKVSCLKSMTLINERCLDLQKKNTSQSKSMDKDGKVIKRQKGATTSCPYFRQIAIEELRDVALTEILDIEDLISTGRELTACPYYASRKAAEDAEVVLIPYNTLLHKATRDANGIVLKNNIVIIDEAHNLLEALAQMHNVDLNYSQVYHSLMQLKSYKKKFSTRFAAKNLLLINQLIFVISQLLQMFDNSDNSQEIFTIQNFVLTANIDNYNMFKLIQFCKQCRLAQKIRGYALKCPVEEIVDKPAKKGVKDFLASINRKTNVPQENLEPKNVTVVPPCSNPLLGVISFLESLTYSCDDGRILFKKSADKLESKLQFLLLNPSSNFSDVVKEARSVIVAGGTMKPTTEFRNRLFVNAGASPDRIIEFSCDHIIPPENILPIIVTTGQNKEQLLFDYENRMKMGAVLKDLILQACKSVKGGIVVFFPSYSYENWIWQQMQDINFGRSVFREPQNSSVVDAVLQKYADVIKKPSSNGALLFSVVGGKLSEGLNFSDDLGRCIIVVGLPYSNIKAVDLKEKMNYLDKMEGCGSGRKFYENQCMKAVNQCIGRAVRHRNDYATVLLLDERYNRSSVKNALPNWIKNSLKVCNYNDSFKLVNKFFDEKKQGK